MEPKVKTYKLESLNLELTTKCPLRCPQCYCSLEGGKDFPLDLAVEYIREAGKMGAGHIELSGGETLCYPHLTDVVRESRNNGIEPNIAISGWHFDEKILNELIKAGIGGIFVSINAPTAEKNAVTRDGFEYGIHALQLLYQQGFEEVYINWVMHRDNADTLPEMIRLAERYNPKGIVVMTPKPDAAHTLNSLPTLEQMEITKQIIKQNKSKVKLCVESCFSPLLAMLGESPLWGNLNRGIDKGCSAGLISISINVDGLFSPCRHLDYFEKFESLQEYWEKSEVLKEIRSLKSNMSENCNQCSLKDFCRPCLAVNSKLNNKLYLGNEMCPVSKRLAAKQKNM